MRSIADRFVGGIERIDVDGTSPRPGLSLRAVSLGLFGVIALSVLEPFNQNVFENTMLIGNHFPIGVVFVAMLLVLVVNPILAVLPTSRSLWSPVRLLVVWFLLLAASLYMWQGPVDLTQREEVRTGLPGFDVGLIWALTGVCLAGAAIIARLSGHDRHHRDGRHWLHLGVLVAVALVPAILSPLLSQGLGGGVNELPGGATGVLTRYVVATLICLAISWPVIALLRRQPPLSAGELVVITSMMFIACAVIWSGFHRFWAHQLIAPFRFIQSYPRWEPFVSAIPAWMVPSTDPENIDVIRNFYVGNASVPWPIWCATALKWLPFLIAYFMGAFLLMALFRRQWEEAEKLSFPLAGIILETLRPPRAGRLLNDMFGNKRFWWTFAIVVAFQIVYGLHRYFPDVPEIIFKFDLHSALEMDPWRHLPHHVKAKDAFFIGIGIAFFLSTEMSFSLWGFVIILALVEMTGKSFQYSIHEHFSDYQIGSYIAYAAVILWVARRHLARTFRALFKRPPDADANQMLSERTAAIGFLVCFLVAAIWLCWAGMTWYVAALVTLIVFILTLVVGRIVAESGLPFIQYKCWPHMFAESTIGPLLSAKAHALAHVTTIAPTADAREMLMPYALNSARMADGVENVRRRRLFALWLIALTVAFLVAGATQLHLVYRRGASNTDQFAGQILSQKAYNSSADFADLLDQDDEKIAAAFKGKWTDVGIGVTVVIALCLLRYRFLWWPLHPVGFLVAHTYPMQVFWLSIMIGWLCKTLVMRLGGVPVYRKLQPVFLAMIVATTFSSIFWILVKMATFAGGEQGQAILFLPS